MPTAIELYKSEEFPFNPGEIVEIDGWPRWKTRVKSFELILDIVTAKKKEGKPELGIASFVVMEQEQPFLDYAGSLLAEAIDQNVPDKKGVVLLTVESKGCHFVPWVWENLADVVGEKLEKRIVTFRKGQSKVYMQRPAVINGQEVVLPQGAFYSITSPDEQNLIISPKDIELLYEVIKEGIEPVFVDDFIGQGGTIVAVHQLFQQLGIEPLHLVAVVGSDGNLYKQTFAQEGIDIVLLPRPFPLKLPTFTRQNEFEPWRINI